MKRGCYMSKTCPQCGKKLDDKAFACDNCGARFEADMGPAPVTPPPVAGPLPFAAIPRKDSKK